MVSLRELPTPTYLLVQPIPLAVGRALRRGKTHAGQADQLPHLARVHLEQPQPRGAVGVDLAHAEPDPTQHEPARREGDPEAPAGQQRIARPVRVEDGSPGVDPQDQEFDLTYLSIRVDGRLSTNWSLFGGFTNTFGDRVDSTLLNFGIRYKW